MAYNAAPANGAALHYFAVDTSIARTRISRLGPPKHSTHLFRKDAVHFPWKRSLQTGVPMRLLCHGCFLVRVSLRFIESVVAFTSAASRTRSCRSHCFGQVSGSLRHVYPVNLATSSPTICCGPTIPPGCGLVSDSSLDSVVSHSHRLVRRRWPGGCRLLASGAGLSISISGCQFLSLPPA